MKGYVVCVYKSISSEEKLKEYALKAKAAVEKYEGKFVIRGGKATTNEGEKSPRTVVLLKVEVALPSISVKFPLSKSLS